jgi:hypothetical protein
VPQLRVECVNWLAGSATGSVNRVRHFPDNRFIGRRDTMLVFDCDDQDQFESMARAASQLELDRKNLLQTFAPDTVFEAANRGFSPA